MMAREQEAADLFGGSLPVAVPLAAQIEEVERELRMRRHLYPDWVRSGRMKRAVADRRIGTLEAVLVTLRACAASAEAGDGT